MLVSLILSPLQYSLFNSVHWGMEKVGKRAGWWLGSRGVDALATSCRRTTWARGLVLAAALAFVSVDAARANGSNAITVFGGKGTEEDFSGILERLFQVDGSEDRVVGFALSREVVRPVPALGLEVEALYARHYGRETYHEVGAAAYLRWHVPLLAEHAPTTFAVGLGPSLVSRYPILERDDDPDIRSRLLNQFNLEASITVPSLPRTMLILRLQHRSGVFGLLGGVTDASNFLTVGLRQTF